MPKAPAFNLNKAYNILFGETQTPEEYWANKRLETQELLGAKDKKSIDEVKKFVRQYCSSKKYKEIFGESDELEASPAAPLDKKIEKAFLEANNKYKYFAKEASGLDLEKFAKCYKAFKFRQIYEEGLSDDLLVEGAYKAVVLFNGDIKILDQAINTSMGARSNPHPAHDIAIKTIPELPNYQELGDSLHEWQSLIKSSKTGGTEKIIDNFQHAIALVPVFKKNGFPKNLKQLEGLVSILSYKEAVKAPEIARIFSKYNISENRFDNATKLLYASKDRKKSDLIPDVIAKHGDYYAVKLPAGDPRSLILGDITGCCQSFDGHSKMCVRDGMTLPNNGFYVYLKAKKGFDPQNIDWGNLEDSATIVGQSYAWRGKTGNIAFDSLEVKKYKQYDEFPAKELLMGLSEEIMRQDPKIERITLGKGGGTEAFKGKLSLSKSELPEKMRTGIMYGDAREQYEILISDSLKETRERAKSSGFDIELPSSEALTALKQTPKEAIEKLKQSNMLDSALIYSSLYGKSLEEVSKLSKDKISAMIEISVSEFCEYAKNTPSDIEELYDKDPQKFKKLTSDDTLECLRTGIKYDDLEKLYSEVDKDKFEALTSYGASDAYMEKYFSLSELKEMETNKIRALTSENAIICYNSPKGPNPQEIKDFNADKIKMLTSDNILKFYDSDSLPDFEDLKDFDSKNIQALTSDNAIKCYESEGMPSFKDLKGYNIYEIISLISDDAQKCYNSPKGPNFEDLKDFDGEKIQALTSYNALKNYYSDKRPNFEDLKDFDGKKIQALTSYYAFECYKNCIGPQFDELKDFDGKKIQALTSEKAYRHYKSEEGKPIDPAGKKPTYERLKALDAEKINALTADDWRNNFYKPRGVIFNEIVDFDIEKIRALTSHNAVECYNRDELAFPSFKTLKDLSPEKIKILTSNDAIKCYKERYGPSCESLASLDIENIKALISYEAKETYKTRGCPKFDQLKEFDIEKIKALTSLSARICFENGYSERRKHHPEYEDIVEFDPEKIKALTSRDAVSCYREKSNLARETWRKPTIMMPSFSELKTFDARKINALVSDDAKICYKGRRYFMPSFDDLAKFDADKITTLSSHKARGCYEYSYQCKSGYKSRYYRAGEMLPTFENLSIFYDKLGKDKFTELLNRGAECALIEKLQKAEKELPRKSHVEKLKEQRAIEQSTPKNKRF